MPNKKSATRLSANILNYFAAFTETRFNFRTLINYRWTDNELTLDLGIFQDFQDELLQRIKTGDSTPITVKNNEHVLSLSGDDVLLEINKALSDKFGLEYLKSCVEQEIQKVAERDAVFIATEKGLHAADNANLSEQEIKKQNSQAFLDGCRKYNLALRKQIEIILVELQRKQIDRLKDELGIEHVPASTFNPANYLKKHFDALQSIARDTLSQKEYISSVRQYFKEGIDDIVLYDLFISIQKYVRYNTVGTIYLFFHELNRRTDNDAVEGYPIFFIELNLSPGAEKVEVSFPRDLLLINTPAVNYFKFPSVLTASRSSILKNAVSNLSGIEVFFQAQYGWNEPFVLEPYFRPIKALKETYPAIRCRVGFQVVRNENKKLLDYSEIMTRLESDEKNKFVDFISDYIDGNVENTQDAVDREFIERYPIKSAGRYISDNPLNLNISQKRILLALNKPKNRIIVVDGPPGTGKSHTIAAITYWANQEGKSVVITSHKKQALEERDIVYYSFVEDSKYGNAELRNIYPVIDGTADNIRKLKMQRLNVGFSRAKDTMVFVHSMPVNKYGKTRLGDAIRHYDKLFDESKKNDFFIEDTSIFESPPEKDLYNLLINTAFVKTHREHVKIIPQFKIGEYIRAEYAKQIPKYRVDFLMTFSKGGKEQALILEYDGVEYHTKSPDIVTKHNFSQEYLDYDISRQIEIESYGYRFLRLNKFNLRPEQDGETKTDVLDRFLRKVFVAE